jgi:hypothetical protein
VGSRPLTKLHKGCTRLATANDKVYQLLAHGRWFSQVTPASFTTKTGGHDIAKLLLKMIFQSVLFTANTSTASQFNRSKGSEK